MRYKIFLYSIALLLISGCSNKLNDNNSKQETKDLILHLKNETTSIKLENIGLKVKELVKIFAEIEEPDFSKEEQTKIFFLLSHLETDSSLDKYKITLELIYKSCFLDKKTQMGKDEIKTTLPFGSFAKKDLPYSYKLLSESFITDIKATDIIKGKHACILLGPCHPCKGIILINKDILVPYTICHLSCQSHFEKLESITNRFKKRENKEAIIYTAYNEVLFHNSDEKKMIQENFESDKMCLEKSGYKVSSYNVYTPKYDNEEIDRAKEEYKYLLISLNDGDLVIKNYFPENSFELGVFCLQSFFNLKETNKKRYIRKDLKEVQNITIIPETNYNIIADKSHNYPTFQKFV